MPDSLGQVTLRVKEVDQDQVVLHHHHPNGIEHQYRKKSDTINVPICQHMGIHADVLIVAHERIHIGPSGNALRAKFLFVSQKKKIVLRLIM